MEYRYHKMARNEGGWVSPVAGRLREAGPSRDRADYLGRQGFGYEDWNFAGDLWSDGKLHLYLQSSPARADRGKTFSIILGYHQDQQHFAAGLCRNATYSIGKADLPEEARLRRARQLHELDKQGQLDGPLKSLSIEQKAKQLFNSGEVCWVTLEPDDLIKFEAPIPIPSHIVKPNANRYQLQRLDKAEFDQIAALAEGLKPIPDSEPESFPEGAQVARTHLTRERSREVVSIAKTKFKDRHGALHCEACNWPKGSPFQGIEGMADAIEAHHDIPLSSADHSGETSPDDLRMLCPTCHRAIHRLRPWLKTSDFKAKYFPD